MSPSGQIGSVFEVAIDLPFDIGSRSQVERPYTQTLFSPTVPFRGVTGTRGCTIVVTRSVCLESSPASVCSSCVLISPVLSLPLYRQKNLDFLGVEHNHCKVIYL